MSEKKIAIFTDELNGPLIASATKKLGYRPYVLFSVEPKGKEEIDYPYFIVDPFGTTKELATKIEKIMGTPDVIIPCVEQSAAKVARYAESLGMSVSPVEAYDILRDKVRMKSIWQKEKISTPASYSATRFSEIDLNSLQFPVIVKPIQGAASAGVRVVFDEAELKKQVKQIMRFTVSTQDFEKAKVGFLIEEYIDGEEYSVDTIWFRGKPILNAILSKGNEKGPCFPDRLYLIDPLLPLHTRNELLNVSYEAVKSAGVISGATHTEIRMRGDKGYVIESALRPGAGGFFYQMFEKALGVSFYEALILTSIPNPTNKEIELIEELGKKAALTPKHRLFWYNLAYAGSGTIESIEGIESVLDQECIDKLFLRKFIGDYIPPECQSYSYFGWILGEFKFKDTIENYYSLLNEIEQMIQIKYLCS